MNFSVKCATIRLLGDRLYRIVIGHSTYQAFANRDTFSQQVKVKAIVKELKELITEVEIEIGSAK